MKTVSADGNYASTPHPPNGPRKPRRIAQAPGIPAGVLCLALLPAGAVPAQSADQWRGPEEMYAKSCRYCHESQVSVALFGRQLEPGYIRDMVRRGGTAAMPAFKPSEFTDRELDLLADYIFRSQAPAAAQ